MPPLKLDWLPAASPSMMAMCNKHRDLIDPTLLFTSLDVVKVERSLEKSSRDVLQTYANMHVYAIANMYNYTDDTKAFTDTMKFLKMWFLEMEQQAGRDGSRAIESMTSHMTSQERLQKMREMAR